MTVLRQRWENLRYSVNANSNIKITQFIILNDKITTLRLLQLNFLKPQRLGTAVDNQRSMRNKGELF